MNHEHLFNQIGDLFYCDGLDRADKSAHIAVPAIVPVFHKRVVLIAHPEHISWAIFDAQAAPGAFVLVNLYPVVILPSEFH
jgi:hypothetical protein